MIIKLIYQDILLQSTIDGVIRLKVLLKDAELIFKDYFIFKTLGDANMREEEFQKILKGKGEDFRKLVLRIQKFNSNIL